MNWRTLRIPAAILLVLLARFGGAQAWRSAHVDAPGTVLVSGNGRIEAIEIDIATRQSGQVAGIHMSDIPSFPYRLLWGERCVRSVANLTRADGEGLIGLVAHGGVATTVTGYALEDANTALDALRAGRINGAAVLVPGRSADAEAPDQP